MKAANIARLLLTLTILGWLAGCAGPVRIEVAPATLAAISTVDIITPPEPKTYAVLNFGHPGMAFGLIGGIAAAADQASKQDQLTALLKKTNLNTSRRIAEEVATRLTAMGYRSRTEEGPWEEKNGGYSLAFENIKSDADAVMIIIPTIVGFVAPGMASDYLPTITAVATLLGKDRKNPLYRGYHVYGWEPMAGQWKHLPPSKTFENFAALYSDSEASAKTLTDAALAVSHSIATDLKR